MLCLTLRGQTVDLRWPDGTHLVLHGPTATEPRIRVSTPDLWTTHYYPAPTQRGQYTRIVWGEKVVGLIGRPHSAARSRCSVNVDVERDVEVKRRSWHGPRRRAS